MASASPTERLLKLVRELGVARIRDFKAAGIHHQYVFAACKDGLIKKIGSGTYAFPERGDTFRHYIAEACKRAPQGVVCLFSALWFHGLVAEEPKTFWMAIDRKGRIPHVDTFPIKFVSFSGDALTQGVVNLRVDGVPVRVYSAMKTVADCFKYSDKVGQDVAPTALAAAVSCNKYNRQKLLRFAEICRVKQAVAECEKAARQPASVDPDEAEKVERPVRIWDRETLAREVWSEPIRQLAKKYGVSDVAIHKHCKKMGITLPGRGYWAKKASIESTS